MYILSRWKRKRTGHSSEVTHEKEQKNEKQTREREMHRNILTNSVNSDKADVRAGSGALLSCMGFALDYVQVNFEKPKFAPRQTLPKELSCRLKEAKIHQVNS